MNVESGARVKRKKPKVTNQSKKLRWKLSERNWTREKTIRTPSSIDDDCYDDELVKLVSWLVKVKTSDDIGAWIFCDGVFSDDVRGKVWI